MGAKIGRNVVIALAQSAGLRRHDHDRRQHDPAQGHRSCSAIGRSRTSSTSARSTIGSNAFVGEASVIDIDTAMGDNTQLGHASSLQSGQRVPDGKRYHGSPAVETTLGLLPDRAPEMRVRCAAAFSSPSNSPRCS